MSSITIPAEVLYIIAVLLSNEAVPETDIPQLPG